jgi:methylenetetrahydrofolate reductase (NADPH)
MKITDHIQEANGRTLFSFEILPPLKGQDIHEIYNGIAPLMEFKPPFIDVTYHREEFLLKPLADGTFRRNLRGHHESFQGGCGSASNLRGIQQGRDRKRLD